MQQSFPCPACGSQNAIGQQFCGTCGEKFQYNCPHCSGIVDSASRFCPNCGAELGWRMQQEPEPKMPPMSLGEKRAEGIEAIGEKDRNILRDALQKGTPCIPFIPINAIQQSLSVLKPEGFTGYFIVRIPTLFPDGTMKYLYKEEFNLWLVTKSVKMESQGRTYFFVGLHQDMEKPPQDRPYLEPQIFYQSNFSLYDVEFREEIEFFRPAHSPLLELTFIPADHNIKIGYLGVVNFMPVAILYPIEERQDPSGMIQHYDEWKALRYPTSGAELESLLHQHVQHLKSGL